MNEVLKNIKSRRSVRSFTAELISKEDLAQIAEAGAWAPTGNNRQSFRFTVLGREKIEALANVVGAQIGDPAYDFYKPAALILVSNDRGNSNGLADCACALQNIFLFAHSIGIGSVWINQFKLICDEAPVRAALGQIGIPAEHIVWGVAALGYAEQKNATEPQRKAVIRFVK